MKFLSSSIILSFALLFSQGLAVPVAEAEAGPEPGPGPVPEGGLTKRVDTNWLKSILSPTTPQGGAPASCPTQQTNQCSTGVPYCCSTDSGSHNCVQSNVNCQQKVICCNNSVGFQMCIGDIDFNMPINININLPGGKKKN